MTPPTSKALEEAVERLAHHLDDRDDRSVGFHNLRPQYQDKLRDQAREMLTAAWPGLFDADPIQSQTGMRLLMTFAAMRDAYLNAERKD